MPGLNCQKKAYCVFIYQTPVLYFKGIQVRPTALFYFVYLFHADAVSKRRMALDKTIRGGIILEEIKSISSEGDEWEKSIFVRQKDTGAIPYTRCIFLQKHGLIAFYHILM